MLHLIFQSPIETAIWGRIEPGDVIIFLENAVLRVLLKSNISDIIMHKLRDNRLCVLSTDIATRGISPNELIKGVEVIDYAELVELTINNSVIQSWT